MSNWADLLGDDATPNRDPQTVTEARTALRDLMAAVSHKPPRDTGQVRIDQPTGRPTILDKPIHRTDGPEPEGTIVRMRDIERPDVELARCPNGGGWWWCLTGDVPPDQGWEWGERRKSFPQSKVCQVYPELADLGGPLARSMALALPQDELWWQIGTSPQGVPVWAWHDANDEDEYQILCQARDPDCDS